MVDPDADVRERASAYLRIADRLLPGRISAFYVVGSAALGEYVPGRSDVDFVAVVPYPLGSRDMLRLRALHLAAGASAWFRTRTGGTPNGVFVLEADIRLPVSQIRPVASHTGYRFEAGEAFDVNPVVWKVLEQRGLTIRGPAPGTLGLDPEPHSLTMWNLRNLNRYWRPWGEAVRRGHLKRSISGLRYGDAWAVGWGTLGAPRLHYTITTGEVIGKRSAGEYALTTFDPHWHDVIKQGISWWDRDLRAPVTAADARRAGEFVVTVVGSANALARC